MRAPSQSGWVYRAKCPDGVNEHPFTYYGKTWAGDSKCWQILSASENTIDTPGAATGDSQEQKDKTVQYGRIAAIH